MPIKFSNNASSQLNAGISDTDTSITTLTGDGSKFPVISGSDYFMVTLGNAGTYEILKCTARSGDTLTVVRAQEGTTALTWPINTVVSNRVTAETLSNIARQVNWEIKTTNYTAVPEDHLLVNTTSGEVTITLPSTPNADDVVSIADYAGTFSTNKLTVARNGNKIMGLSEDLYVQVDNSSFDLVYTDTTQGWRIL